MLLTEEQFRKAAEILCIAQQQAEEAYAEQPENFWLTCLEERSNQTISN